MLKIIILYKILVLQYLVIIFASQASSQFADRYDPHPYSDRFRPYPPNEYFRNEYPDHRRPPLPPPPPPSRPKFNPYTERHLFRPYPANLIMRSDPPERRPMPPPPDPNPRESKFDKLFSVLGKVMEKIKVGSLFSGKSKGPEGMFSSIFGSNSGTQSNLAMKSNSTKSKNKASKLSWLPGRQTSPDCDNVQVSSCNRSNTYRLIDGSCNNLDNIWWGMSRSPYKRLLYPEYEDSSDQPRVKASTPYYHLPNSRQVAMNLFEVTSEEAKAGSSSLFTTYFAEFVAFDIASTPRATFKRGKAKLCRCQHFNEDCFNIQTPFNDEINKHNQSCMTYTRSLASNKEFDCDLGLREQLDLATHWLDLSIIYGNDETESTKLRSFKRGFLRTNMNLRSRQSFLPYNQVGQCKHSKYSSTYETKMRCYASGDKRVEDNAITASIATIWLREHNRVATHLGQINPLWTDEKLFQETRRIVIAEYQNIVFSEFLPTLVGVNVAINYQLLTLKEGFFEEYSPSVYPQAINEFATAASKFYQTTFPDKQKFPTDSDEDTVKPISYFMFNNPLYEHKMPNLIRGVLGDKALKVKPRMDKYLQDNLYNNLFYDEETKRWSLSALNIQQGRDHGLPSYNKYRKLCGLCEAKTFSELDHIPPEIVEKLAKTYACPDDIDLYVGLMSEKPLDGALVGPTTACIMAKQFHDLKFGDRFYFETSDPTLKFTLEQIRSIRKVRMSDIICRNVEMLDIVQKYVFYHSDFEWNQENRCHLPTYYHNRRHHQRHHDSFHHHRHYYHLQNPNLFLWFEDSSFNCTQYLQFNNTQVTFVYSFFNSITDNSINFLLTYPSLPTGINAHAQCFPVNRTVIITFDANQPNVNLNFSLINDQSYNASVLFYIQNVNSLLVDQINVDVSRRSTFGFYPLSIQSSVTINQSATFNANNRSKIHLQFYKTPSVVSTGNWTVSINDSSVFDLCASNITSFTMNETVQVTADTSNQNYTSCHLISNRLSLDFSNIDLLSINQLTSTFYTGGSSSLQIRRVKTFNSASSLLFQAGNESANATYQNTHFLLEMCNLNETVINELAFRVYDSAKVIAQIEHVNTLNISSLSTVIAGTGNHAWFEDMFKMSISHVDQVSIDSYNQNTNKTQACSNLHNITGLVISNQLSYSCDSCELNFHNITSANVTLLAVESYSSFELVRIVMGPGLDYFHANTMSVVDYSVNSTMYFDLRQSNFIGIETLTFNSVGHTNFTIIDMFNTTITNLNGAIASSSIIGFDLIGPGTNKFAIVSVSNPAWLNQTIFVDQQPLCGCQQVQIN